MSKVRVLETTHVPDGYYVSKAEAAKYLNIPAGTLQYHIGKGHLVTVNFPDLGHMINEWDVLEFKEKLDEIKPGRPTIYEKV